MGGGAPRKTGGQPHETDVRLPESAALLSHLEADEQALPGSRRTGLGRVPLPWRARRSAEGQGERSLQARALYPGRRGGAPAHFRASPGKPGHAGKPSMRGHPLSAATRAHRLPSLFSRSSTPSSNFTRLRSPPPWPWGPKIRCFPFFETSTESSETKAEAWLERLRTRIQKVEPSLPGLLPE